MQALLPHNSRPRTAVNAGKRGERDTRLRALENLRRILFDEARDGVFVVDENQRIVEVNRSFAAMLRCTHEEALEASPLGWHAIYADAPERQGLLAGHGTFEAPMERMDGTSFEAQVSYNVARWERRTFVLSVCRDVSERSRDERALLASTAELKSLSRRLVQSEEAVRRRIATELHDRVGGAITAINLNLTVLRRTLPPDAGAGFGRRLDDSLALLAETNSVVRELMTELRPPVLDDYGLAAALRWYGEGFGKRAGLDVQVSARGSDARLAPDVEITLFRLVQEALTNIVKHANARTARIVLEREGSRIRLTVADDGAGFEPWATQGTARTPSWGIVSMRERAESIGGHLRIDSAPGHGTRVGVELKVSP